MLKPVDSAGSVGLRILESREELDAHLADGLDLYGPHLPNLLAEAFVPGRMCHVDGLVVDGRTVFAWPSQYQYTLASYRTDTGGRLDLTLDTDDPLTGRLLEFTDRAWRRSAGRRTSPSTRRSSTRPTTDWCCARSPAAPAAPRSATSSA